MTLESGKYTVAWFKLAEFVGRKEKERALAMYKLLAHSLYDEALAAQLEGDILLSFDDQKGLSSHAKAAALYAQHGKLSSAAALYENLSFLMPDILEYISKAASLYARLDNQKKFSVCLDRLCKIISAQHLYHEIDIIAQSLSSEMQCIEYYEKIIISLVLDKSPEAIVLQSLNKVLEKHVQNNSANNPMLSSFLSHLSALDDALHEYACRYIQE